MSFDPCNRLMKILESIGTTILKVGAHLGMGIYSSHFIALPGSLLAHTFANPCLGRKLKVRVVTLHPFPW
jgi:hypothetical protein